MEGTKQKTFQIPIMTRYQLTIVTFKTGVAQKFEFETIGKRELFLTWFINNLQNDHVINITFGERTFAC